MALSIFLVVLISALVLRPPEAAARADALVLARGVSPGATAENSQRKLVVDARGTLFLAYVRPVGGRDQVVLASSDDRGRSWRHTQLTQSAHPARLPSLSVFPDGSLHLVWTEYSPVGRVLYRSLRGGRWSEAVALSQRGVYAGVPVVAPAGRRPHVLWYGIRAGQPDVPTRHSSVYEILSSQEVGGRWTAPVVISPGVPDSLNPSLDTGRDGSLHAAWFQFDGRTYQVRHARFDGRWSRPRTLTTGRIDHNGVALDADGQDVHLVWAEGMERQRAMYGRPAGGAVRLSGDAPAHGPVVGAASGVVVAVWSENQAIVLRPLSPPGASRVLGRGDAPMVAVHRGVAYVAWTQTSGSSSEVRFASVRLR